VGAPTTAAAAPAASPKPGGTLKAMQAGDLASVDGHYYTPGSGLSAWIVFDTLTEYDDNLKPQPALAESWDQSSDSKQISLTLRKGVTFHSGREVTSDDLIYNLNRILDFKLTAGIITGFVPPNTQWAARDKYTVTITTEKPWINVFDFLQVFNILDKNSPEGPRGKTTAVGTGAFSMVEWVQGEHVTYAKNKNYWRTGKPLLDQIILNIAKDQQAMTVQLEAGQVDFIVNPTIQDFVRLADDSVFDGSARPDSAAANLINFHGGRLRFGKLTMTDTDLEIVDADARDPLDLFLARYTRQLVAGTSRTLPNLGLRVLMPDYRAVAGPTSAAVARQEKTRGEAPGAP
jgi:peptide/nickel transport system substrate-binding protein